MVWSKGYNVKRTSVSNRLSTRYRQGLGLVDDIKVTTAEPDPGEGEDGGRKGGHSRHGRR